MFRIILFLLLLLPTNVFAYECSKEMDEYSKELKIKIFCNPNEHELMSDQIKGNIPKQAEVNKFLPALKEFVSSYDISFIRKNIDEFFLLDTLKYQGNDVGGLSNGKKIYISVEDLGYNYYIIYLKALHHEFSSNILKSSAYEQYLIWKNISADYYETAKSFFLRCINNVSFAKLSDDGIYAGGFIINYGKTNAENDFNTYAEYLFTNPAKINELKKYEKIKTKINLLKKMYRILGYTGKFPDEP